MQGGRQLVVDLRPQLQQLVVDELVEVPARAKQSKQGSRNLLHHPGKQSTQQKLFFSPVRSRAHLLSSSVSVMICVGGCSDDLNSSRREERVSSKIFDSASACFFAAEESSDREFAREVVSGVGGGKSLLAEFHEDGRLSPRSS